MRAVISKSTGTKGQSRLITAVGIHHIDTRETCMISFCSLHLPKTPRPTHDRVARQAASLLDGLPEETPQRNHRCPSYSVVGEFLAEVAHALLYPRTRRHPTLRETFSVLLRDRLPTERLPSAPFS